MFRAIPSIRYLSSHAYPSFRISKPHLVSGNLHSLKSILSQPETSLFPHKDLMRIATTTTAAAETFRVIPTKEKTYDTTETHNFSVEVISKYTIKPSNPTPNHLETFELSAVDQTSPPVDVSLVFFFSGDPNKNNRYVNEEKIEHLRKSLSNTLTSFYPLAGTYNDDNLSISCTDQGVNFFEARVSCPLDKVLRNPQSEEINCLLPSDNFAGQGPKGLLSVQASFFDCGGMAIGINISHKVMDAGSISLFLNNWAASARGSEGDIILPKFDIRSFFPPRDDIPVCAYPPGKPSQKVATKRFLFSSSNLAALKAACADDKKVADPTRVEALSALIWSCAENVAKSRANSPAKSTAANIIMNIRGKMTPPLQIDNVGNMVFGTLARSSSTKGPGDLSDLVDQLRKALRTVDTDYVSKLQTEEGFSKFLDTFKELGEPYYKGDLEFITITSWSRFPFYQVDFGWGAPKWVCPAKSPGKNIFAIMDREDGDGLEAWISLDELAMASFEREPQLLSFSSQV